MAAPPPYFRRRSQVVRQRSAKPPFGGSNPPGASGLAIGVGGFEHVRAGAPERSEEAETREEAKPPDLHPPGASGFAIGVGGFEHVRAGAPERREEAETREEGGAPRSSIRPAPLGFRAAPNLMWERLGRLQCSWSCGPEVVRQSYPRWADAVAPKVMVSLIANERIEVFRGELCDACALREVAPRSGVTAWWPRRRPGGGEHGYRNPEGPHEMEGL